MPSPGHGGCQSVNVVKNGMTYYGKQNHKCKYCKRQFVEPSPKEQLDLEQTVRSLLLERISLRGICRTVGKSMGWLMHYLQGLFEELPEQLPIHLPEDAEVDMWCLEADEMWSFVGKKANKQWIWLRRQSDSFRERNTSNCRLLGRITRRRGCLGFMV